MRAMRAAMGAYSTIAATRNQVALVGRWLAAR